MKELIVVIVVALVSLGLGMIKGAFKDKKIGDLTFERDTAMTKLMLQEEKIKGNENEIERLRNQQEKEEEIRQAADSDLAAKLDTAFERVPAAKPTTSRKPGVAAKTGNASGGVAASG